MGLENEVNKGAFYPAVMNALDCAMKCAK